MRVRQSLTALPRRLTINHPRRHELNVAEGAGFEPARQLITVYTLSRHAPSTARPPLRGAICPPAPANSD